MRNKRNKWINHIIWTRWHLVVVYLGVYAFKFKTKKKMMDHFRDLRLLPISFFTLFLYVFSIDSLIRLNYVRQMVCMETATTTTNSVLQQWTSTGRIFSNEFEIFKLKFNFKSTFNRKTHKLSWVASMCVYVCKTFISQFSIHIFKL